MMCGEKLEEITTQKGLFKSRGFSLVIPDVTLNSLNWGTAVLVLSKLLLRMFVTHISAQFWLLQVSGVSPTYNPSAGTGTDGRCGVKNRNTYTLQVRKIEACLFHRDTSSSPYLKFSKKSRGSSDTMTCACLTACSCHGPGLCPGAF